MFVSDRDGMLHSKKDGTANLTVCSLVIRSKRFFYLKKQSIKEVIACCER